MTTVALTGGDTPLGRRTRALLEAEPADADPVEVRPLDHLRSGDHGDLKRQAEGTDLLVHLATGVPTTPTGGTADVETARRIFDAASSAGVSHLIVLSDATVYGAWANNPVPLTEDAVLRPNPGFTWATERAEIERLAGEWRAAHPRSTVTVLRPVRTTDHSDWLIRALRPTPTVPELADDPPAQFLHCDDLATAVAAACRHRLDGAYNVAPDRAIPGDQVRSLTGTGPKVRLPERLAARLVQWRFRSGLGPTPPELVPYTLYPWVVANDRLRATGWGAEVSNEEACVEAHEAPPWATISPRRRQEIALGVAGAGILAAATGGALAVRRWLRR